MRATTAVIPAAGLGTRFLPATKAVPKELLPIVDTPALQLIVDECVGAGFEHVVVVTSRAKPTIEQYFEPRPDLVAALRAAGREEVADRVARIGRDARISFAYQDETKGLGHAVGCARATVGDQPFAVLLPDELLADSSLLAQMADLSAATGGSVVGLKQVPRDEVHRYGVIDPAGPITAEGVVPVRTMVEKPRAEDAPSDLILIGRYVLTPDVFDCIDRVQPGAGGEIQLTDALCMQAAAGPFHGVLSDIGRHDTGNPLGWLQAVLDRALDDPTLAGPLRAWLAARG
jgi:UTP--glucose-1-phosphate uridylyltransferase